MNEHQQYLETVNQSKAYVVFLGLMTPVIVVVVFLLSDWGEFDMGKAKTMLMIAGYSMLQGVLIYWGVIQRWRVFAFLAMGFQLFHAGIFAWLAFSLLFDSDEGWALRLSGFMVTSIVMLLQFIFAVYIFGWSMRLLRGLIPADLEYSKSLTQRDGEEVEDVSNLDLLTKEQAKWLTNYSGSFSFWMVLFFIISFGHAIDGEVAYAGSMGLWQMVSFFGFQLGLHFLGYYRRWKWMAVLSCFSHLFYGLLIVLFLGIFGYIYVDNGFTMDGEHFGWGILIFGVIGLMTYCALVGICLMILFTYRLFTRAGNGDGGGGVESDDEIDDRVDLLSQVGGGVSSA